MTMSQFIAAAEDWLISDASVPADQSRALAELMPTLLQDCTIGAQKVIAISGPPGTGKSTLAGACVAALGSADIPGIVISLDDYYLPAVDRSKLSRKEHPLFSVRGVPGTHDLGLLLDHLQDLADPGHPNLNLPLFDKSRDDRRVEQRVVKAGFTPAYIFVEGWIAGAPPQAANALLRPLSAFEEKLDSDGEWRSRVNAYLYDYHSELDPVLDSRWHLRAPDWDSVIEWRFLQERTGQQDLLKDRNDIVRFLDHYQRLCTHMHDSCGEWADIIIQFDHSHVPEIVNQG
jgi:D-glycerate 3-kinase